MLRKILLELSSPAHVVRWILRRLPLPFSLKLSFDATERAAYAYGIYSAARQAKLLGLKEICAIEFGVAGGSGLVNMAALARVMEKETSVKVKVYGFDRKEGHPAPEDYRDTPYI